MNPALKLMVLATHLSLSASTASPLPPPSPPRVIEDAVGACAKAVAGDACRLSIEGSAYRGVCLAFPRTELVCAIEAPQ